MQDVAWISCEGDNPVDAENIGVIGYLPERAFRFDASSGEFTPLVAVQFEDPKSKLNL